MPAKMTAEEYRKIYGSEPGTQAASAPQKMTAAEFETEYGQAPIVGNWAEGLGEVGSAMVTGAIAEPIAGLAGIGAGILGEDVTDAVEGTREALTYTPETETGRRYLRNVGEFVEPLAEGMEQASELFAERGADLLSPFGERGAAIGSAAGQSAIPAMSIVTGGTALERVAKMPKVEQAAASRADKKIRAEMEYQGMDPDMVNMFRESSPQDKQVMREMLDIVERGLKNPEFEINNPYSTPAGKGIKKQYDFVDKKRREAGTKLNEAAKRLKGQQVDYEGPVNTFLSGLDDMGIKFDVRSGKVDFRGSDIQDIPGLEATVNRLIKRMRNVDKPDAYAVHQLKRWIDNNVSYTKRTEGMTAQVEMLMKGLRRDLDAVLDGKFPDYDRWNTVYAETKRATQAIQDGTVSSIDVSAPNVERALGIETRKLLSNYASGSAQLNALADLLEVANKYGGNFSDNLVQQAMFVQQLRAAFPRLEQRKRTFAAESGGLEGRDLRDPRGAIVDRAADAVVETVRGKRDEAALIAALKALLSEQPSTPRRTTAPPLRRQ